MASVHLQMNAAMQIAALRINGQPPLFYFLAPNAMVI